MRHAENNPGHIGVIPSDMKWIIFQPLVCIIALIPRLFAKYYKHFIS